MGSLMPSFKNCFDSIQFDCISSCCIRNADIEQHHKHHSHSNHSHHSNHHKPHTYDKHEKHSQKEDNNS